MNATVPLARAGLCRGGWGRRPGLFGGMALVRLLALVGPLLGVPVAQADMRCGVSIVSEGLLPYEVLERCGEPQARSERPQFLAPGVVTWIEEWLYDQGDNRFRRLLVFREGRLTRIELRPKPRSDAP